MKYEVRIRLRPSATPKILREQADVRGATASTTPCCGIGFLGDSGRSGSTKEESQPPMRAKVGATLVPCRKSESIMKAELIKAASEVITNQQILVTRFPRRSHYLPSGNGPPV